VRQARGLGAAPVGLPPQDPLKAAPQARLFSAAHDLPDEWHAFLSQSADVKPQTLTLRWTNERFPAVPTGKTSINVDHVLVLLKVSPEVQQNELTVNLVSPNGAAITSQLKLDQSHPERMARADFAVQGPLGMWSLQITGIPPALGKDNGTDQLNRLLVSDLGFLVFFSFA
jgi:hypothetical protein